MRKFLPYLVIFSVFLTMMPMTTQSQGVGGWEFEFVEEDEFIFNLPNSDDAKITVEFEITNSYLVEIEIEITVEGPFNGELLGDDPLLISVGAGTTKTDDFKIGNIELFQINSPGGAEDEFRALATLKSIGGIDVSMANDWKDDTGTAKMPRIYDLRIGDTTQNLEFNPDIETSFSMEITNHGNLDDQIGNAEVSDDCSLMTVKISEDSELTKIMKPQIASTSDSATIKIDIEISAAHPSRNCDVDLRISSGGSGEGDGIVWTETSFRVTVKEGEAPSPVNDDDDDDDSGPINEPIVTEQNLPSPGFSVIIASLFLALIAYRRE